MRSKPALLYLSPVIPAATGNGLAMRAGMVLEALSQHYDVSLLVRKVYAGPDDRLAARFADCCGHVEIMDARPPSRSSRAAFGGWLRPRALEPDIIPFHGVEFDVVHVFRLIMVPFAQRLYANRASRPRFYLDLDDIESRTRARLAALYRQNGDDVRARVEESAARRAEAAENEAYREFDRLYVCSNTDKAAIEERVNCELLVVPNAVRSPTAASCLEESESDSFRLLFVATLNYYPNEDAALYLCREIAPRLRQVGRRPFEIDIVGSGASSHLRAAALDAGVELRGPVPDLEPWYQRASVVVVPIRAGGGTRIKIIEAFSHRRPVVSTSVGAEGIDARHEQEIMIANDPDEFCRACLRLMADRDLANRIAREAYDLFARCYSLQAMRRALGLDV